MVRSDAGVSYTDQIGDLRTSSNSRACCYMMPLALGLGLFERLLVVALSATLSPPRAPAARTPQRRPPRQRHAARPPARAHRTAAPLTHDRSTVILESTRSTTCSYYDVDSTRRHIALLILCRWPLTSVSSATILDISTCAAHSRLSSQHPHRHIPPLPFSSHRHYLSSVWLSCIRTSFVPRPPACCWSLPLPCCLLPFMLRWFMTLTEQI